MAQLVCGRARTERERLKTRRVDAEGPKHKLGIDARAGARASERDALALDVGHGLDARLGALHQVDGLRVEVGEGAQGLQRYTGEEQLARKSVVYGKSVTGRVDLGGRRIIKQKKADHMVYILSK